MSRSDLAHSAPADLLAVRLHRYAAENVATFDFILLLADGELSCFAGRLETLIAWCTSARRLVLNSNGLRHTMPDNELPYQPGYYSRHSVGSQLKHCALRSNRP